MIMLACFVILLWSCWGILCPNYNDGIVGKLILSAMAFASLAVVSGAPQGPAVRVLVICMAAFGFRDFIMRHARRFGIERRAHIGTSSRRASQ